MVGKWFEASSYCIIFAHIALFATLPLCHIVSYCIREIANFVVNIHIDVIATSGFPQLKLG